MTARIAVTGANGFIGTNVVRASSEQLRVLIRGQHLSRRSGDRPVIGRLEDIGALDELLAGVDTLIHCANYIGPDAAVARRVNADGTARLVDVAMRHGVRRVVYLSTSGVYGDGPHIDADEHTPTEPTSATSATRLEAERTVIDAGGAVVRPHLVVGAGDTRVGPVLRRALQVADGVPTPPPAMSVITSRELARQLWSVASSETTGVVNAHHGAPVDLSVLHRMLGGEALAPVPVSHVRERLERLDLSAHQVEMLTAPSTFTSRLAAELGPVDLQLDAAGLAWYRMDTRR